MHYIRLLRPAKIHTSRRGLELAVLFTITTDLGDSFLSPEDGPLELTVAAIQFDENRNDAPAAVQGNQLCGSRCTWKAGMRVLDVQVRLWPGLKIENLNCRVAIFPTQRQTAGKPSIPLGALYAGDSLPSGGVANKVHNRGVIMPATVDIVNGTCAPIAERTLALGRGHLNREMGEGEDAELRLNLQFQEDIGESIARHIWDAGVVTSAYLADACSSAADIQEMIPFEHDTFNVLELGTGVGILGLTIASILPAAAAVQGKTLTSATVLLTDLEDAEERARLNITKADATLALDHTDGHKVNIDYENLDWDEGREGRFGPLATATPWDLVVLSDCTYNVDSLPALVGTLSALHEMRQRHRRAQKDHSAKSSVLLATKPRHSSEQALFELLDKDSWRYRVAKEIPLPSFNSSEEDEVVQIYLLEKGGPL
ncbi:hypothetical protein F5Y17DRAFT_414979 [Xylariaceae sp. FL0594]|nr:hypothetical protein F5Y17DRAFT_414979 [Xylariaceae sp. FL0594]